MVKDYTGTNKNQCKLCDRAIGACMWRARVCVPVERKKKNKVVYDHTLNAPKRAFFHHHYHACDRH